MLNHLPILVNIHQRKFQFFLCKKKPLSGVDLCSTSYILNHFCHFSKVYQNLYLFDKSLIYASRKRTEKIYILRWPLFHFGPDFCINLKNGINFPERHQILNREGNSPHLSCSCNHCWVIYCDYNFSFNWQAFGILWELVTRWWISFFTSAGWSNKPKADIDICHSTLEPYRLLCWLVKYFTFL